jgi:hypothetical protein
MDLDLSLCGCHTAKHEEIFNKENTIQLGLIALTNESLR